MISLKKFEACGVHRVAGGLLSLVCASSQAGPVGALRRE